MQYPSGCRWPVRRRPTGKLGNRETGEKYSDTWLKAKIVTAYALNDHLNPFVIDVDVDDRRVTLAGEVES
ncbi:MAG: BON domain-containing protein [Erysipelotrichaceae bacterium]|nr:BON domain-containing protein [Erysipelotrichaceae bacterium]